MEARQRLEAMVRTDPTSTTVWSEQEVATALEEYREEVLAAAGPPAELPGVGWQAELATTHEARYVVHRLRKQHAAGAQEHVLTSADAVALAAEFDRLRTLLSAAWTRAADKLATTPHSPAALTGPAWYGQGWDDAVNRLRDLADHMEP